MKIYYLSCALFVLALPACFLIKKKSLRRFKYHVLVALGDECDRKVAEMELQDPDLMPVPSQETEGLRNGSC